MTMKEKEDYEVPCVYDNVWYAIADTVAEAEILTARSILLLEIAKRLEATGWSHKQTAKRLGLTRPRVDDLFRQRIDRFTVEDLIGIGADLDIRLRLDIV